MNIFEFETFTHDRMRQNGKHVIINSQNICFGADSIRSNNLEQKKSVQFKIDKSNPYVLGFEFRDESHKDIEDSYKLVQAGGRSRSKDGTATRQCSASALYRQNKQLKSISECEDKSERVFTLKPYDEKKSIFFIELTPSFEFSVDFSEIRSIPRDKTGIYRCYNTHEEVVYIGSGLIAQEAIQAQKKSKDQFKFIEYSLIEDRDKAYDWERFHQESHREKFGELPRYNKVLAPKKGAILLEDENG